MLLFQAPKRASLQRLLSPRHMSKSSSFTNLGVLKKERKAGSQANLNKQTHDPYIVDSRLRIDIKIQSYQMITDRRYYTSTIMFRSVSWQIKVYCFNMNPAKLPGHLTENEPKNTPTPPFSATGTRNLNSMGPKALWGAGIGSAPGAPLSESGCWTWCGISSNS